MSGDSALMMATRKGYVGITRELLQANADPDLKNMYGETALMTTIPSFSDNRVKIVKTIVNHGADVNAKSDTGETALIIACQHADPASMEEDIYIPIIKTLLNHGADVNAVTNSGNTALIYAAQAGDANVVKMLLDSGADPEHQSDSGETALSAACDEDIEKIMIHQNGIPFGGSIMKTI